MSDVSICFITVKFLYHVVYDIIIGRMHVWFPFVSRPRNFMNKVQRACIMFLKETKPFMI